MNPICEYSPEQAMAQPYGALAPSLIDNVVISATSKLPDNWLGLRLSILLRRVVTLRLPADSGLDVERWGLRMRLYPRRNGCEKGALFTPQMYECFERRELAAEVERAKAAGRRFVFIDIGANVGLFSLFVASYADANARILAFEPQPEIVSRLRFNIDANPGIAIQVFPFALGEINGVVALDIDCRDQGGTRTHRLNGHEPNFDGIRVECRRLLDVLIEEGIQYIDALKIDVEGDEAAILSPFFKDAPETLWPRLLVIEEIGDRWPAELSAIGYVIAERTKLNVMMRR